MQLHTVHYQKALSICFLIVSLGHISGHIVVPNVSRLMSLFGFPFLFFLPRFLPLPYGLYKCGVWIGNTIFVALCNLGKIFLLSLGNFPSFIICQIFPAFHHLAVSGPLVDDALGKVGHLRGVKSINCEWSWQGFWVEAFNLLLQDLPRVTSFCYCKQQCSKSWLLLQSRSLSDYEKQNLAAIHDGQLAWVRNKPLLF